MEVDYVGNPLLDAIDQFSPNPGFKDTYRLNDRPVIALLPGSRKQEIERLLPDMLSVTAGFPDHHFVVAAAPSFDKQYYQQFINSANVTLVFNQTYDLLHVASAAIVASGTATLETALFHVPQVVVYRGGAISVAIARMLVNIKFISLVNLIMDKKVVTELIQEDCSQPKINAELKSILEGSERKDMLLNYKELSSRMGAAGASKRTAKLIIQYFKNN
jgi:lipid-A-disaccharide synthase